MKKIILFILGIIIASGVLAQAPQGITNQGVVRGTNDQILVNTPIGKRVSILQGSVDGSAVYVEIHSLTTNANGLITYIIGEGNAVEGTFADIDWSDGPYFLKTEADLHGGSNYSITGVTQFLSVPYALHSETAKTLSEEIVETDPLFSASPAAGILLADIENWDEAFSWGDHSLADYLSEETDPLFSASPAAGILLADIGNWDEAFSWGDHSLADYLSEETDPLFSASPAAGILLADIENWDEAFSWGDHSLADYLSEETDPLFSASPAAGILLADIENWDEAFSWGDHSLADYLSEEIDPLFSASPAAGIEDTDIHDWGAAFDWGDHAEAGYITEVYEGVLPGEMKYWDGSQWLPIDPPEGDDQVLSFKDGVPKWQAVASHYILPPKALALDADPVGEFSATINGMVNGEGFSTTVVFEWGSDTDYGNTVTAVQSPVTGSGDMTVNAEISGLQAATTYHYRVKASSAVDVTYSEDMMFTTQTSIPQLNTLDVSDITPYTAVSGGDITYDGGLPVTQRGVVWGTEADPDIENNDGITSDDTGSGTFVSSMTGLIPQTAYHVRAYAKNDNGIAYGDQHMFTTIGDEPQANTQQANDITEESAVLAALVNPGHVETTVLFEYGLNEDYGNEVVAEQSPVEGGADVSVSAFIDGLESGTTYHFRVVSENELGVTHGENRHFKTYDGKLTDIDGNIYYTVIIGDQEWMAENLRVTKFNNGDAIPTGLDNNEWYTTTDGAYAIYDHNLSSADGINSSAEMVAAYGKLYNGYAVNDPRGLCPAGWSIPISLDWSAFVWYLQDQGFENHPGGDPDAGNALKSCRQSGSPLEDCNTSEHPRWNPDDTHFGFDEFGFSALPAGYRHYDGGFHGLGSVAYFWHSPVDEHGLSAEINNIRGNVNIYYYLFPDGKNWGSSIRCFRDLD